MYGERGDTEGLLLLDKPTGPTSHDMVNAIRHLMSIKKAGHTGTLDPLASGLLIIMIGRSTKLAPYIPGDPKVYDGSMILGMITDSMDIEGNIIGEGSYDGGPEKVSSAIKSLVGEIEQMPPMFSAAKHQGKPLYHFARMGKDVPRRNRTVRLYEVEMTAFHETGKKPQCDFRLSCSTGFYVRDFASRVGEMLGCGAVLSRLRRTSSGPFRVEEAFTLEELSSRWDRGERLLLSIATALEGFKGVIVEGGAVKAARNGAAIEDEMIASMDKGIDMKDTIIVLTPEGEVIGLHEVLTVNPIKTRPRRIL